MYYRYYNIVTFTGDGDDNDVEGESETSTKRLSKESGGKIQFTLELFHEYHLHSTPCVTSIFYAIGETRVTTPTAIESQLPWKRDGDDEEDPEAGALQQNEFPAWASNKEYLAYNSPSATFLGEFIFDPKSGITKNYNQLI